jgi:hypothetical protein
MEIKDSGTRREFETGAVRDCAEGKGRCDLLPLDVIGSFTNDITFVKLDKYIRTGNLLNLESVIYTFATNYVDDVYSAMLEVAKHYEEGAKKYAERNWEIGIPLHCYIDSAVRHYLKWVRGDDDEPHARAFLWNILGAWWTHVNKPEMIDLPFIEREDTSCSND